MLKRRFLDPVVDLIMRNRKFPRARLRHFEPCERVGVRVIVERMSCSMKRVLVQRLRERCGACCALIGFSGTEFTHAQPCSRTQRDEGRSVWLTLS